MLMQRASRSWVACLAVAFSWLQVAALAEPPVARVNVISPQKSSVQKTTEQPGQIEPYEQTPIFAKIDGFVKSIHVDIGDRVKAGQVLAEVSVPEAEVQVEQKHALVSQARAERRQAEAAVTVAAAVVTSAEAHRVEAAASIKRTEADVTRWQSEFARTEQLAREATVTASLRDETRGKYDAARAALEEARAKARSAEAGVGEARAHLEKARADVDAAASRISVAEADLKQATALLDYTAIRAPFNGVVTRRNVDTGHLTVAGRAGAADPLFVVVRDDRLTVVVDVPETVAPLVGPGDRAEIRLQALDGKTIEARVTRVSWSLNESTRTLRAEIDLDHPDETLRPGLYARAVIIADEHADVLTIPTAAVIRDPGGKNFAVVVSQGKARRRAIELGLSDGMKVEIRAGLESGEAVAASAAIAEALSDGQPVQAIQSEKPAGSTK